MKITILTPTYNRGYIINNLYESLLRQSDYDFKWLIVDDGSTDNTKELIGNFIEENKIQIKYIKKYNGGKHTALNYGLKYVDTPLVMIVDSDDKLSDDAVSKIKKIDLTYSQDDRVAVYSFLRCYSNGKEIVKNKNDLFISDYIEYRIKKNNPGDMAEVFKTDVLRRYPFPEFKNEKFLSEDVVWIEIAKKYKTVFVNIPIYECEYLSDGLTANDKRVKFESPLGSMLRGKQLMYRKCGILANVKGAIIYDCYKWKLKKEIPDQLKLSTRDILLSKVFSIFGILYNNKWKV